MKTKLEMAHEWAMKHGDAETVGSRQNMVKYAWDYADAMQAEADKRENIKLIDDILSDPFKGVDPIIDWHNYRNGLYHFWAMDEDGSAFWHNRMPKEDNMNWSSNRKYKAPSFGYTGDWRNSLRKRPE